MMSNLNTKSNIPYITISTPDIQQDVITLVSPEKGEIKVPFDFRNCPVHVKVKLRKDVYFTEDECLFYLQLCHELPVCDDLINGLIVQYALNDEANDYRSENVLSLNPHKTRSMYLREFVKIPGHYNIFFVVDYRLENGSLICVEVHPENAFTYGMAIVNIKQVLPTTWKGPHLTQEEIQEIFENTDENAFSKLIMSIPEVEGNIDDYDY